MDYGEARKEERGPRRSEPIDPSHKHGGSAPALRGPGCRVTDADLRSQRLHEPLPVKRRQSIVHKNASLLLEFFLHNVRLIDFVTVGSDVLGTGDY